jgi:hypothetical protein
MNDRIARMERRIESLTKEKNAAMEALELASSLGTFDTGMGRCAESGDVIHELLRRVVDMLDFRYSGVGGRRSDRGRFLCLGPTPDRAGLFFIFGPQA